MQKVFLFIKGYVYIRVSGFSPERFMNLCSNRGIFLWGIRKEDESYFMYMNLHDFFLIAPLVRKTRTKVVLLKRIGLPFLVPQIYKRKMFALGMVMTFFLWWLSSFFVWKIHLEGNVKITDEELLRALNEQNILVGGKVADIHYEELEKYLRNRYSDIIWISVKQNGTILEVNLKENMTVKITEKEEKNCNLVATADGIVRDMVVRKGVPMVSIGQEVKKGDVLVSGQIPIMNDDTTIRSVNLVKADADIWIEYEYPVNICIPKVYTQKKYTGRITNNYKMILVNGRCLETKRKIKYLKYDLIEETLPRFKVLLWDIPCTVIRSSIYEFHMVEYENDFEEGTEKLGVEFTDFLENLMEKGVQIISKNVRIEEEMNQWRLTGTVTIWEQAKEEQNIEDIYE